MNDAVSDKALDIQNAVKCGCSPDCHCVDIFSCECVANSPADGRTAWQAQYDAETERQNAQAKQRMGRRRR